MRNIRDFLFGKIGIDDYNVRMSCNYQDVYPMPENP